MRRSGDEDLSEDPYQTGYGTGLMLPSSPANKDDKLKLGNTLRTAIVGLEGHGAD